MPKPSYDEATLAAYFQPVSRALYDDPAMGDLLRDLQAEDPDLLRAVADVDRSQIRRALTLPPRERLRQAEVRWKSLQRLRRDR